MPDAGRTRGPCVQKECISRTQATQGSRNNRHSPRNGFTAYTWSPRCAGLLATVPPGQARGLIPASGDRDRTISPSASAALVLRSIRGHRIPASRFVTIGRNVPLHRGGMRENVLVICPTAQAKRSATDWHDGQIGCARLMPDCVCRMWWRFHLRWLATSLFVVLVTPETAQEAQDEAKNVVKNIFMYRR